MKDPFVYHPPTLITAPKYDAIRAAEHLATAKVADALRPASDFDTPTRLRVVNDACREFVAVIESEAPASADTTTAVRRVRLARMRANESMFRPGAPLDWASPLLDARMWACAAVALHTPDPDAP